MRRYSDFNNQYNSFSGKYSAISNRYNSYTSIFNTPGSGYTNRSNADLTQALTDLMIAQNKQKMDALLPDRSLFDRSMDTLMTATMKQVLLMALYRTLGY